MGETQRALGFARRNLDLRPNRGAFDLFAKAAFAAGATAEATLVERQRTRLANRHSPGLREQLTATEASGGFVALALAQGRAR